MDSKILKGALLAYREVYNQNLNEEVQEVVDEGKLPLDKERRDRIGRQIGRRTYSSSPKKYDQMDKMSGALKSAQKKQNNEELDIFDVVLEFLQVEGYAETLEEAEWMMANLIDEEAIEIITELTGGKGHPGYKAGSKDHGPMQSGHPADTFKRTMKGGTMSQRHGDHLGDLDDDDDDDDGLEAALKDTARKKRENVRKPLRNKVKAARKVLSKEEYVSEEQLQELSDRKLRAYVKKSEKSHQNLNKKWDQGTATYKDKYKSINREYGQERALKKLNKESFELWLDEAMTNYEKNRKRAAMRAAMRNDARAQGKTGAVPGVGYVTPRKERETWTDESGKTRHAKGL